MAPQPGSTQDSVALDDDQRQVIADIVSSFQQRGIATELTRRVLDDVRATGKSITILCPIVRAFIDRYPQYADPIDHARPGVSSIT
jgi:predicted GNAT family acetyltransferase